MTMTHEFARIIRAHNATILSENPVVAVSFEKDLEKNFEAFRDFALANPSSAFLLQLGFEHETAEPAGSLAGTIKRFNAETFGARVVVLCNAPEECKALGERGVETRLVQHNAFLDERRYRPMPRMAKRFDAAYIARLTPFKRHGLIPVELAPRLLFMGASVRPAEREWSKGPLEKYAAATWMPFFSGAKVSELLARARCGLILSASEGACFASSEYFLCGLPVVDTPALGGRSSLYPEEFVRYVEATPEAVGAGIAHWVANPQNPWKVRAAWLDKVAVQRKEFADLMRDITGRACPRLPHKLALRTPHPGLGTTLSIQAYTFLKGLFSR